MEIIKKILKYIAYTFLTLLVSLCLYTFINTDILKKDYANVFGYTYFVVATGSMSGTIEVNDVIIVKITDNIKVKDIITYKDKNGDFITHRVTKMVGEKIVTKGDVNNAIDDPITKKDVIGSVKLIISPLFILKLITVFIIVFIALALLNFDKIIKKYIFKNDEKKVEKGDLIFDEEVDKIKDSIEIPIDDMKTLESEEQEKQNVEDEVEVLSLESVIDTLKEEDIKNELVSKSEEKELLDQIYNLLKIKNNDLKSIKLEKNWIIKYQYIYKLANIALLNDELEMSHSIDNPPFSEIYNYDLEEVGLYENLRNKIYDMPIYIFLRILAFCCFYNDEEIFDGIFKILKYKVQIDKENQFKIISEDDTYSLKQINIFIEFLETISAKYDEKNVLDLERIKKYVSLKKYVNDD